MEQGEQEKYKTNTAETCFVCQKVFSKKALLKSHLGLVHVGKIYQCNICNKTFTSSENFRLHRENIHDHEKEKDKFECTQCEKKFYHRILLKPKSEFGMVVTYVKKVITSQRILKNIFYQFMIKEYSPVEYVKLSLVKKEI